MSLWHRVIHPITQHFRRRRGQVLLQHFPHIRQARICDLGGSRHFWQKLALGIPEQQITIYNISQDVTTEGIDPQAEGGIRVLVYDGQHLPVPDQAFDLLVCNSVLEHVPPAQRAALAREMQRVARAVFCQTPARSFPIEPHFLMPLVHWLPRSWGYQLAKISPWRLLARPSAEEIHAYWWGTQLLGRSEVQRLFPGARIETERVAGLSKSYYVICAASEQGRTT